MPHNSPLSPLPLRPLHEIGVSEHPLSYGESTGGYGGHLSLRLLAGPRLVPKMSSRSVGNGWDAPPDSQPQHRDHLGRNAHDFSVAGEDCHDIPHLGSVGGAVKALRIVEELPAVTKKLMRCINEAREPVEDGVPACSAVSSCLWSVSVGL